MVGGSDASRKYMKPLAVALLGLRLADLLATLLALLVLTLFVVTSVGIVYLILHLDRRWMVR
jgi:hypothetical protein